MSRRRRKRRRAGARAPAATPPGVTKRRLVPYFSGGLLLALFVATSTHWWDRAQRPAEVEPARQTTPVRAAPTSIAITPPEASPHYVGVEACVACHADRVDEFRHTAHYSASRWPTAENVTGDFSATAGYQSRNPDLAFELETINGKFVQRAKHSGTKRSTTEKAVGMVFGSGHYDENYHYWEGDQLFRLPLAWLRNEQKWLNTPGYQDGSADFERVVGTRCLECHATWIEHVPGTANRYRRETALLGITCERCHGPASAHVDAHTRDPDLFEAVHVVRPAELSRERNVELCAQCHGESSHRKEPPFSYVPGQPLGDYFTAATPKHPELDHTANQSQQMEASACFQRSDLTCVSCHDPHHEEEEGMRWAETCLNCHGDTDCYARSSLPSGVRDQCIACHMPSAPVMNITFSSAEADHLPLISRHDHRIAVHPVATQEVLHRWWSTQPGPEALRHVRAAEDSLASQWADEMDGLVVQQRYAAGLGVVARAEAIPAVAARLHKQSRQLEQLQKRLDTRLRQARDSVQLAQRSGWKDRAGMHRAVADLRACLSLQAGHSISRFTLATILYRLGNHSGAAAELPALFASDPEHVGGVLLQVQLAEAQSALAAALTHARRAETLEPYNVEVQTKLGTLLAQGQQWGPAAKHLRAAAEIAPTDGWIRTRLARVLLETGELDAALRSAQQAVKLTASQDAAAMKTLRLVQDRIAQANESN